MTHKARSLAAGLTAAFMAFSSASQAQFFSDGPLYEGQRSNASSIDRWMPGPDSDSSQLKEQHNLLKPHEDFIMKMRNCCTLRDGRGNLEEVRNNGEDPRFPADTTHPENAFPYIVVITHDLTGRELNEPVAVYIPKDKVISAREAKDTCKSARVLNPNSTCIPPSFNVLWAYDNSLDGNVTKGTVPYRVTNIYCYWPQPGVQ